MLENTVRDTSKNRPIARSIPVLKFLINATRWGICYGSSISIKIWHLPGHYVHPWILLSILRFFMNMWRTRFGQNLIQPNIFQTKKIIYYHLRLLFLAFQIFWHWRKETFCSLSLTKPQYSTSIFYLESNASRLKNFVAPRIIARERKEAVVPWSWPPLDQPLPCLLACHPLTHLHLYD